MRRVDWYIEDKKNKQNLFTSFFVKTKEASLIIKKLWVEDAPQLNPHTSKVIKLSSSKDIKLDGKLYLYKKEKLICKVYALESSRLYTLKSVWILGDNTRCKIVHYEPGKEVLIENNYTRLKSRKVYKAIV